MKFDKVAKLVPDRFPNEAAFVEESRLFVVERNDEPLEGRLDEWEPDQRVAENFRLPFPVVAIEQQGGNAVAVLREQAPRRLQFLLVVFHRSDPRRPTVATGVVNAFARESEDAPLDELMFEGRWMGLPELALFEVGKKRCEEIDVDPELLRDFQAGGKEMLFAWSPERIAAGSANEQAFYRRFANERHAACLTQVVLMHLEIALLELVIINSPARFVVEERPAAWNEEPPTRKNGIRPSSRRSRYIVLSPDEIRSHYIPPDDSEDEEDGRVKRTPHERRGHFRTYRSERYRAMRGRVVWIEPCWIGPREAVRWKNRYIVRLDV